jgi:transposase
MKAKQSKAQYTLEFKREAIRLVKSGQPLKQVATTLGMPHQTLDNWMCADNLGKLSGTDERPRKTLDYKTPFEVISNHVALTG